MALRFGVIKTILLIALLIVIVQLITVYHFTLKYTNETGEKNRRKVNDINDYIKFNGENVRFPAVDNQHLTPLDEAEVC